MYNCCYENTNDHNDIQWKAPQPFIKILKPINKAYHETIIKYKCQMLEIFLNL